jgi:hypothetical protein
VSVSGLPKRPDAYDRQQNSLVKGINTSTSGIWKRLIRHLTEHVVEAVNPMCSVEFSQRDLSGIMPVDQAMRKLAHGWGVASSAEKYGYSIGATTCIPRNVE